MEISLLIKKSEISCQNNRIILTPNQVTIFTLLNDKYKTGDILSKAEILEYGGESKAMNMRVHIAISRIIKNLENIGCEKVFIENMYVEGYRLVVLK